MTGKWGRAMADGRRRIYLDNAATSFPKPPEVGRAMCRYLDFCGANANRGSYSSAYEVDGMLFDVRHRIASLFGAASERRVVFTKSVTESLNVVLKGLLSPGDHVVVSSMEHNAVMRPLVQLGSRGVSFTRAPCDGQGRLDPSDLERCLRPETRAVVMTHASNVCGTILPIEEVGALCAERGLVFVVDAAQTAGTVPIDVAAAHVDALCLAGHKGLLGPQGTGGIVLSEELATSIDPLVAGGTGSASDSEEMPAFLPDRLEAGTLNLPGIAGLGAALEWLERTGPASVRAHELALTSRFIDGLEELESAGRVRRVGLRGVEGRTGVVSVQCLRRDAAEVAFGLDESFGIMVRVGLHCAPSAHRTLGTFPTGTVRFSFGWANEPEEVDAALDALRALC